MRARVPNMCWGLTLAIIIGALSPHQILADQFLADNNVPFEDALNVPEEPEDYRKSAYREPVPTTLKGAKVLSNKDAMKLWQAKNATFIDVLPRAPKPPNLPKGTIWRDKKRENIPGSIWLVNVGYGILNEPAKKYFKSNMEILTKGDKSQAVVFYCLADCWMSWNAAKRAIAWGYKNVSWYPEGTDGWTKLGGELERSKPVPAD